jgi:hypothetical protein
MRIRDIEGRRPWRHRVRRQAGPCRFYRENGDIVDGEWEWGYCETGRQRVADGFYVVVRSPDAEYLGSDQYSLVEALRKCGATCLENDLSLDMVGLSPRYRESGLSENSGWGYHPDHAPAAVSMFAPHQHLDIATLG